MKTKRVPALAEAITKWKSDPRTSHLVLTWVMEPFDQDGVSTGWSIAKTFRFRRMSGESRSYLVFEIGRVTNMTNKHRIGHKPSEDAWRVSFKGKRPVLVAAEEGPSPTFQAQMAVELMWPRFVELLKQTKNFDRGDAVRIVDKTVFGT